ncbi:MAG TPA: NAD(P)H-hydrate dehydratase [Nitrospirae bacterium]|nr:NAD(P)H-hydrate dehydratase [Nitrospirota bacterium]
MLKIATAKQMRQIDRDTIKKYGISGTVLMERAGLSVVDKINGIYPKKRIIVLCGGGNNGGDGLVAARVLHNQGRDVKVFLSAKSGELKGDAKINYNIAKKFGVRFYPMKKFLTHPSSLIPRPCLIVDALLGTGLNKKVKSSLSKVIKKVNRLSCPVMSVDIPSGISSDAGQVMGCAIKAQHTVTFGLAKHGHLLYPGADHTGKLHISDIGFPRSLLVSDRIKVSLVEKEDACSLIPQRPRYSHKGTYGHVLLVAGSKGKTGAAFLAAKACLRTGAGLVTIGVPESLSGLFQSRVTEEMVLPLPDKGDGTFSSEAGKPILQFLKKTANVLVIGPGLSVDKEISELVSMLVRGSGVPVVIDADGVNALVNSATILKKSKAPVILTPHPGEMARLLQDCRLQIVDCGMYGIKSKSEIRNPKSEMNTAELRTKIEEDRINTALSFSKKTRTYLVLKGVPTVIAVPGGRAFFNSTGNPGMATAGTGDVLTGMLSALLAQGLTPEDGSVLGVYMHGMIGDIVAEEKGKHSLIASDIIRAIPRVFRSVGFG